MMLPEIDTIRRYAAMSFSRRRESSIRLAFLLLAGHTGENMKRAIVIGAIILLAAGSLSGNDLQGRKYGSIVGNVTEKSSGNPVFSAPVQIEGTTMGALTDREGKYLIINVPVGKYSLVCKDIGYIPLKVVSVEVTEGQTTIDFSLEKSPCSQSAYPAQVEARVKRESALPLKNLRGADHDLFLAAAQIAGTIRDPWQQGEELKYVVNRCCASNRFDLAVDILESIQSEASLSSAFEGIDTLSIEDRREVTRLRSWYPDEDMAHDPYFSRIKPFPLKLDTPDLDRLLAISKGMTAPDHLASSLIISGSQYAPSGERGKGRSILQSTLPLIGSVADKRISQDMGKALINAGDSASGVKVLAETLTPPKHSNSDSCDDRIIADPSFDFELLWDILDVGAYDVALASASPIWDSAMVQREIAVALAKSGRCQDALTLLGNRPGSHQREYAVEQVAIICSQHGDSQAAIALLPLMMPASLGDSATRPSPSKWDLEMGEVAGAYAECRLFDKAQEIASTIADTNYHCRALIHIAENLLKVKRQEDALQLLKEASVEVFGFDNSELRDQIFVSLARVYMAAGELSLARQALLSLRYQPGDGVDGLSELAFMHLRDDRISQALEIADLLTDSQGRIDLKADIADSCLANGNGETAVTILDVISDSITISHPYVFSGEGGTAERAVSIYARAGEFEKALELSKRWTGTAYEPSLLTNIAEGYLKCGHKKEALKYLQKSLEVCASLCKSLDTYPMLEVWQRIIKGFATAGDYIQSLATIRQMKTSARVASELLADLAVDFDQLKRAVNRHESKELGKLMNQYLQ